MERNYGPEGIALNAAGIVTALPGQVIGCIGIALLLVSGSHGPLYGTALAMIAVGVILVILGSIR
jgi:hypothetical protein